MTENGSLTTRAAAKYLGVSVACLTNWRRNGAGPAYVQLGRRYLYRVADLDKFLSERTVEPGAGDPASSVGGGKWSSTPRKIED